MANDCRLIDANALLKSIKEGSGTELQKFFADVCVATAPTVDAVEVVHGGWIHASNKPGVWIGMKCSLCGARIRYSEYTNGNHNYCHKCGAKMDGGNEDV